jgi:hypothetical protein
MLINAFVEQFIEGYLFSDLESMATLPDRGRYGNCGYSMVLGACTGIELLGWLTHSTDQGRDKGWRHFSRFWSEVLYASDPARATLAPPVRRLVREGIAHVFVAKPSITITKNGVPEHHLVRDHENCLLVDCLVLFHDLKTAFQAKVKPMLATAHGTQLLQNRLDHLGRSFVTDSLLPDLRRPVDLVPSVPEVEMLFIPSGAMIAPSGTMTMSDMPANSPTLRPRFDSPLSLRKNWKPDSD